MKRSLLVLASLAFVGLACSFLTLFTPATTPTPAPATRTPQALLTPVSAHPLIYVRVVAVNSLYLRAGPGMFFAADNKVLNWGDLLLFDGTCARDPNGTRWLHVSVDGRVGWVSQAFVTPTVCESLQTHEP